MVWSDKSRQARGYGADWDKARVVVLNRDCGLCQPCLKNDRNTVAQAVDHIVSKAKAAQMGWGKARIEGSDNLQAICKACHLVKTVEETGKKRRPMIGPDGWPVPE